MTDFPVVTRLLDNADLQADPAKEPIVLVKDEDGQFMEYITINGVKYDAAWTMTDFSNGACPDGNDCSDETCELGHLTCTVCEKDIWDGGHFMCLEDGSHNAHKECVKVIPADVAETV